MKAKEKAHVDAVGEEKFNAAVGRALFVIRQDSRLTGLDKLRNAIAEEAAMRATGYPKRPLILPKTAGEPHDDIQLICEQVLESAEQAASR